MTDKEILDKLEKKFGDDLVYYDNATIRHFSPDLVARKHYAKESLEFIQGLRNNKTQLNSEIRIHCFDTKSIEGFPKNTYVSNNINKLIEFMYNLLKNDKSGVSRIVIEDNRYGKSDCYSELESNSPMEL